MTGRASLLRAVLALGLSACSGPAAPDDVIYTYGATDEAWLTIDDAAPIVDDARAPRLLTPSMPLPRAGGPPVFTWDGGSVGTASARAPDRAAPTTFDRVVRELFPVARAHLPPVTGPMYRLVIQPPGGAPPVRVLSGQPQFAPSGEMWGRMNRADGFLSIELVGAYLETGRITEGPSARTMDAEVEVY
jgi:hypothetical protein